MSQDRFDIAHSMGIDITYIDVEKGTTTMIYGMAHELMAGDDAPDHAFREYGTDFYEEQVDYVEKSICENCGREVRTLYPVHCTEADPTHVDYHWCRVCINAVVDEDEEGVPF